LPIEKHGSHEKCLLRYFNEMQMLRSPAISSPTEMEQISKIWSCKSMLYLMAKWVMISPPPVRHHGHMEIKSNSSKISSFTALLKEKPVIAFAAPRELNCANGGMTVGRSGSMK
jgi:hypothetical protein